jgi:hypothetical protein
MNRHAPVKVHIRTVPSSPDVTRWWSPACSIQEKHTRYVISTSITKVIICTWCKINLSQTCKDNVPYTRGVPPAHTNAFLRVNIPHSRGPATQTIEYCSKINYSHLHKRDAYQHCLNTYLSSDTVAIKCVVQFALQRILKITPLWPLSVRVCVHTIAVLCSYLSDFCILWYKCYVPVCFEDWIEEDPIIQRR